MAINREQARAAGYTDQEIDAFEAEENTKAPPKSQIATADVDADEPPAPTTQVPQVSSTNSMMGTAALGAGDIAEGVKNAAIPIGEGVLAYKGIQGWRAASEANKARAAADAAAEAGRAARFVAKSPVPPVAGQAPVAPPQPAAPPAQPTAMNFLERMAGLARTYAPLARGATGVAAAVTPGNTGQNYGAHFPQTGPQRGMEINPATGQPWTPQELQQYSQFNR